MEVLKWNKTKRRNSGFMVRVNSEEAIKIIQSLSTQLAGKNPNAERIEFYTKKHEYFSIVVHDPPKVPSNEMEIGYIYDKIKYESSLGDKY